MLQVYREKCRQEMEELRKKQEELVQAAEERLEQVRSESKQAEETLQMMQVNEERSGRRWRSRGGGRWSWCSRQSWRMRRTS